jgi:hypothetical protein
MFDIEIPTADNAIRIAQIHVQAMDSNPLLHVQFPTPESLTDLLEFLRVDTILHLDDHTKGVLVARDPVSREIVSFIKWEISRPDDKTAQPNCEQPWPESCVLEYLDKYTELAEAAKGKIMGQKPCYREPIPASIFNPGAGNFFTSSGISYICVNFEPIWRSPRCQSCRAISEAGGGAE